MKCPSCGADLPDRAKFCLDCGASLAPAAPTPSPRQKMPKAIRNTIIILIVIITVCGGVIAVVLSDRAGAVKRAKDSFRPPAEEIRIDLTGDDPSGEKISFTYDDRGRIAACSYRIERVPYEQTYAYDDDLRTVTVTTAFRKAEIASKEIDYDRVKQPGVFTIVDGYYLRLDKQSLGGSADTPAPTEPPAESPTEPPAPSSDNWQELYTGYLSEVDYTYLSGELLYLNDDDLPELVLFSGAGAHAGTFHLCWIDQGAVQETVFSAGSFTCRPRSGLFCTAIGGRDSSGWELKQFDGRTVELTETGRSAADPYSPDSGFTYTINGEEVTQETFDAKTDEILSWDRVYSGDWPDAAGLPDYIRSFS